MARKHPVEIPPPSPSSSEEEEGNPSSEEEQEEEDKVNNTNAGKDDGEDADETEEEEVEEEDSDENPSSGEEQEEEEEEEVEDGMEVDKVNNAIVCKDDEDDDDETDEEEEEEEEEEGSDSDSESESDLLSLSPSAFKIEPVSPLPLPTSENGKAAVRKKVEAETLKIEANGEVGGEKIEANRGVKRKIDIDTDKIMWEKYPLLDASLTELESELRAGGALFLRQNIGLIGKSLMDELESEWRKLKQDEVKLFSRKNALIAKQAGLFLDLL